MRDLSTLEKYLERIESKIAKKEMITQPTHLNKVFNRTFGGISDDGALEKTVEAFTKSD